MLKLAWLSQLKALNPSYYNGSLHDGVYDECV